MYLFNYLIVEQVHSQLEVFLMIDLKGKFNVCRDERSDESRCFQINIVCIL